MINWKQKQKREKCILIDVAMPADWNVTQKEPKKLITRVYV